jgi:hypothetical protein
MRIGECCAGEYTYDATTTYAGGGGPLSVLYPPVPPVIMTEPILQPMYPEQYPYVPKPTTQVMPTMVGTAQVAVSDVVPDLTPGDLLRPLPSIVDNQPVVVAQCDSFAQWVDENPLLAAGILMGLAYMVFKKG